jgi:NAD(P)H-dependent flavin oxidoreductase YrpB (nitropropane dioxygenase family)
LNIGARGQVFALFGPRPPALPVVAAPMFLISGPELVIEACRSGIIGAFPTTNAAAPRSSMRG